MPKGFKGAFQTDLTDFYLQRSVEKLSRELKEAKCKPYIRVPAPAADIGLKEGCQAAFASELMPLLRDAIFALHIDLFQSLKVAATHAFAPTLSTSSKLHLLMLSRPFKTTTSTLPWPPYPTHFIDPLSYL